MGVLLGFLPSLSQLFLFGKRSGIINVWHDRTITAGSEWEREIDVHLNTADIILLLVSPDFMDSDYCYGIEMKRAMERHERGDARVIPIILRHVYWQRAPFGKLQALPTDAKPVTDPSWHILDRAFFDIAEGIREVAEALFEEKKQKEEYLLLKQRFEKAYFTNDDEAILTAYDNIQHSSHRQSFTFSSSALQRIDLALHKRQIGLQRQTFPQNEKLNEPKIALVPGLMAADKTDVGKLREQNQDYVYKRVEFSEKGDLGLFIVADGEDPYGEVASRLTVTTISKLLDSFFASLADQPSIKLDSTPHVDKAAKPSPVSAHKLTETEIAVAVEEQQRLTIQEEKKAILSYSNRKTSARGLSSTVTAVLVQNDQAYIANVGNSRTYLLRDNQLTALTLDHSQVARLVESKQITAEEVYTHPQRHFLYRSLGADRNIDVDTFHEVLRPGDKLLLCSDGLWEMVHHHDLQDLLKEQSNPQATCAKLITLANMNGGEDNISAIVVYIGLGRR